MKIEPAPIAGVHVIRLERQNDERGFFSRVFDRAAFARAGLCCEFPEHSIAGNESVGLIRGLHLSRAPHEEAKVIRCVRGSIFDVVVDLRQGSATYAQWFAISLEEDGLEMLYVPPGCAHGYQTLSPRSEVQYLISTEYVPDAAAGVRYDDPQLAIPWPLPVGVVSARDRALPNL